LPEGIAGITVAAALLSAFLHAAWNAAVKASADPKGAMAAQVMASGLVALPLLAELPLPSAAALPWLAGSALFNFLTFLALLRGYEEGGGFGLVYPLARAVSPLLVLGLASAISGEAVSGLGTAGIALVSGGVAFFAYGEGRQHPAAFLYALLAGGASAAYAVCDANGVRHAASVLGYGFAVSVVNALVFASFYRLRTARSALAALRSHSAIAILGAAASTLSYLLILWVWSRAPVALGAALRDTSLVFAALIAAALGERLTLPRLGAIALVTAGACAIRFA